MTSFPFRFKVDWMLMNAQPASPTSDSTTIGRSTWLFSWPLLVGVLVYLFTLYAGKKLLSDDDTYLHIGSGHWMLEHGAVPATDPFSHTMRGAQWTAHEWLSQVLLAIAHDLGGWTGVVAITALAFAATIALLTRALLRPLEPIYALLFATLAVSMTLAHLLARPHILVLPLMMIWAIGMVRASEAGRTPSLWLLPVMTLWANMHGGFTLGLALTGVFGLEAVLAARHEQRAASVAKFWVVFLVLAVASALITPHGTQGILFTWHIFFESSFALDRISEWQSPNFHKFQVLEIWLLAGLALFIYQGLRLPPIRLFLLLGLLHFSLKHVRNIELLGLLLPLFLASPLATQWRQRQQTRQHLNTADRFFQKLARPAGGGAIMLTLGFLLLLTLLVLRAHPIQSRQDAAPTQAIRAVQEAGIHGPVLNNGWGGYLLYVDIPPFIDGRSDMYGDDFLKEFLEALELKTPDSLEKLLHKYNIEWTLLPPNSPAVALLDHLPEWRRLYADTIAVVHVKNKTERDANPRLASLPLPPKSTSTKKE